MPKVHDPHGGHHSDRHAYEEAEGQQPGELEAGAGGGRGGAAEGRGGAGRGAGEVVHHSGVIIQDLSEERRIQSQTGAGGSLCYGGNVWLDHHNTMNVHNCVT